MKLSIEVEINPEEIELATELLQFLTSLSQQFGGSGTVVKNAKTLLLDAISKLGEGSNPRQVSAEVMGILRNSSFGTRESLFEELEKVFLEVTFNQDHIYKGESVVPYLRLIPELEEPFRLNMRDKLISRIMQVLVMKRPISARREDFFLYAEAFAGMVQLEYISLDGAATTIEKLLNNVENRAAALTVFGKTAELCAPQLLDKCDSAALEQLKKTVQGLTEDCFMFDLKYICSRMRWTHPLLATSNGKSNQERWSGGKTAGQTDSNSVNGAVNGRESLVPVTSWEGHKDQIYAMCYDSLSKKLVTGGKEGICLVWGEDGRIEYRIPMREHYVCALDMHPQRHLLFAVGVCSDTGKREPPCISIFSQESGWQRRGVLTRPGNSLISCVKTIFHLGSDGFATGEEVGTSPPMEERVCYYDLGRASSLQDLQPEMHFTGHADLVTCITSTPLHPMMLFSGSRDRAIRIWDRRTGNSAGILGSDTMGKVVAHETMVTWVDVGGTDLVSSGGDGCVAHWDLRKVSNASSGCAPLQRIRLGDSAQMLLKVAINSSPRQGLLAAADLDSLYLVDLRTAPGSVYPAVPFPDGRSRRYFDLKWSEERNVLYASSEQTVDVYQLQ